MAEPHLYDDQSCTCRLRQVRDSRLGRNLLQNLKDVDATIDRGFEPSESTISILPFLLLTLDLSLSVTVKFLIGIASIKEIVVWYALLETIHQNKPINRAIVKTPPLDFCTQCVRMRPTN